MDRSENEKVRKNNEKKESIYRLHQETMFPVVNSQHKEREKYPWEELYLGSVLKINKEYFRCKGSDLHPVCKRDRVEARDCGGASQHGLPMRGAEEFIYPILIELLNHLQEKSGSTVVITTGHRCPQHNGYADALQIAQSSKHQIGAEVDFYIEHFEDKSLEVVQWLMDFYQENPSAEYHRFLRCQKNLEGLKHPGWYNKEIAIRVHEKEEGRDFDNRHPYPYITIEVRFDRTTNEPVSYDWAKAYNGYRRN